MTDHIFAHKPFKVLQESAPIDHPCFYWRQLRPAARATLPWSGRRWRRPRAAARGRRPPRVVEGGEKGSASPPPDRGGLSSAKPPRPTRGLGVWCFVGLGSSGPSDEEGRVPGALGGAVHRRVVEGPEQGRAWEAGRARPSQEDSAAAPARRFSGTST